MPEHTRQLATLLTRHVKQWICLNAGVIDGGWSQSPEGW